MNLDDTSPVERTAVEEAAKAWANRRYRNTMAEGPEQTEKEFRVVLRFRIKRKTLSQKAISCGAVTQDRRQAPARNIIATLRPRIKSLEEKNRELNESLERTYGVIAQT
jgi:hypothetical protein